MSKFQVIALTLTCGKCKKETKLFLPLKISEEDWLETKKNLQRLHNGEDPSKIYLKV